MRQLEVRLSSWESRQLKQLRDHAASARVVKRAVCVLRSAAGQAATDIARVVGLSLNAVTGIRRRWRRRRLRSLLDRPRSGRPPRVTAQYRRELRRALRKGPLACGFVFTVWSVARLNTYLRHRTGIAIGSDWLRRLVHQEGWVIGRPKHTLANKRDEQEYRRTKRRLEQLKKGRSKRTHPLSCGMPTPPRSTCCPTWHAAGCPRDDNRR
ncbi:MAG TPA: helix-turn-helix domain-containing protein [Pirellulales bacterium]|jgi:transposase|nr:helix-turn-helix domain-containing protein [Pirellulales bacterium]